MDTALTLWNTSDVALVKSMVADKATDAEFRLLIHLANKYQLDPLAKQIYCIKYKDRPAQIFAGLAGFVDIAQRSGRFGGIVPDLRREDEPFSVTYWDSKAGQQQTFARAWQYVATATVWRTDSPHPVVAQVWEEEYSTGRDLWATKPRTMITKVAMCQALRLAFSISGLYDRDEMGTEAPPLAVTAAEAGIIDITAQEVPPAPAPQPGQERVSAPQSVTAGERERVAAVADRVPVPPPGGGSTVTDKQIKAIYAIARAVRHLNEPQVDNRCQELYGCLPAELPKYQASQFIDMLKSEQAA